MFLSLQTVALWDLRNLKLKLHSFESHKDEIFQVILLSVRHPQERRTMFTFTAFVDALIWRDLHFSFYTTEQFRAKGLAQGPSSGSAGI